MLEHLNGATYGQLFLIVGADQTGSDHLGPTDPEKFGIRVARGQSLNQTGTEHIA